MPSGVPPMPISTSTSDSPRAAAMAPAMSPSEMNRIRAPVRRTCCDQVVVAGPVQDADRHLGDVGALDLGDPAQVLRHPGVDVDHVGVRPGRRRASPCRTRRSGRTSRPARRPRAPPARSACPCSSAWCRRSGRPRRPPPGPVPSPTCSPLKSIGALSFSPSPITTTPRIGIELISLRMASTAAPSPPSLSPRPTQRPAAIAAASVTRTRSRARLRSRSCGIRVLVFVMTATPPRDGAGTTGGGEAPTAGFVADPHTMADRAARRGAVMARIPPVGRLRR